MLLFPPPLSRSCGACTGTRARARASFDVKAGATAVPALGRFACALALALPLSFSPSTPMPCATPAMPVSSVPAEVLSSLATSPESGGGRARLARRPLVLVLAFALRSCARMLGQFKSKQESSLSSSGSESARNRARLVSVYDASPHRKNVNVMSCTGVS